jgi:hypothetical protein
VERVADEHDRHEAPWQRERGPRLLDGARDEQEAVASRKFGELPNDRARRLQRHVQRPHRARVAMPRQQQMRQRESLGHVTRGVDAHQTERHALGPRTSQRDQPVAHLLEAHAEAHTEVIDVVAVGDSGCVERVVRKKRRAGDIRCEHASRPPSCGGRRQERGVLDFARNRCAAVVQLRREARHFEASRRRRRRRRNVQRVRRVVVARAKQRTRSRIGGVLAHVDAMPALQIVDERALVTAPVDLRRMQERVGRRFERGEVVVPFEQEVVDLLHRHQRTGGTRPLVEKRCKRLRNIGEASAFVADDAGKAPLRIRVEIVERREDFRGRANRRNARQQCVHCVAQDRILRESVGQRVHRLIPIAPRTMQRHERARPVAVSAREFAGRAAVQTERREQRLGGNFTQVVLQTLFRSSVQFTDRQLEFRADAFQQHARDAALVRFDQVQIRRRDPDTRRKPCLRDAECVATIANLRTDQGARHEAIRKRLLHRNVNA